MEQVYVTYSRLLYKVALEYVDYADADDIINSACEKMCKKIYKMRGMSSNGLRGYVVRIVKNTALDHLNKNSKLNANRDYSEEALDKKATNDETIEDYVLQRTLMSEVRTAIDKLPKREKEVMIMRFYHNMSPKEVANELNITENNLRGIVKRARAHIIQILIEMKRIDINEIET